MSGKGPIFLLQRLLVCLGFSTLSMVGDLVMELQAELALDIGSTTNMQLIVNFEEEASVLVLLQSYLHGFRSEAGDGDTTRWYQETFSIKKLQRHLTLPEVFPTALDDYPGDTGETNLAFDAFFGWLKKEAVALDLKQRRREKQQLRPSDSDATFATGSRGDRSAEYAKAAKQQQGWHTPANNGWNVGRQVHCNGTLVRKDPGQQWHYDGQLVTQQGQIIETSNGPLWVDGDGEPRYCREIDKTTRTQCTGIHPRAVCPIVRKNKGTAYKADPNMDVRKAHHKKRKSHKQTLCTYWAKGSCRKGNSCDFLHTGNPGRNNDWNKKQKRGNHQHKTNGASGGFDKAAMQTMATIVAQAVTTAMHPPPGKGGAAADTDSLDHE
jgi:hypothetical protein